MSDRRDDEFGRLEDGDAGVEGALRELGRVEGSGFDEAMAARVARAAAVAGEEAARGGGVVGRVEAKLGVGRWVGLETLAVAALVGVVAVVGVVLWGGGPGEGGVVLEGEDGLMVEGGGDGLDGRGGSVGAGRGGAGVVLAAAGVELDEWLSEMEAVETVGVSVGVGGGGFWDDGWVGDVGLLEEVSF